MSRRFALAWEGAPNHRDVEAVEGRLPHRPRSV